MTQSARRILVVDDHAIVRAGLRAILDAHADLEVVAEAGTAADALQLAQEQRFDAIVLDLGLPDRSGWDLLRMLRALPEGAPPILILSSHREDEYAIQAMRHGAHGFLAKELAPEELVVAVRRVAAGERYVSASLAARLASSVLDGPSGSLDPHELLTPRELQVFLRIAAGRPLVAIGEELHVSPKTVTSWRSRILGKLGLENNADLVSYALRRGLIKD